MLWIGGRHFYWRRWMTAISSFEKCHTSHTYQKVRRSMITNKENLKPGTKRFYNQATFHALDFLDTRAE